MTLALAWVRRITECEELIFASDSRLSGGRRFDCCPKMIVMPRTDAGLCFAGDTDFAYPLGLQLANAISSYSRSVDRAVDIHDLRGHALKVFNSMVDSIHSHAAGMDVPETTFLLG